MNVGGNQAVTYGGLNGEDGAAPYVNFDGGRACVHPSNDLLGSLKLINF